MKEKKYISEIPELMKEWDWEANAELDPTKLTVGSNKKVGWKCKKCGYKWSTTIDNRLSKLSKTGTFTQCLACSGAIPKIGINDLETTHPEIAKDWDYEKNGNLTPKQVKAGSSKKINWKCHICGQTWNCSIQRRVKSAKCPRCTNSKLIVGYNDLKTKFPEIAKDWDYEKNVKKIPEMFLPNSHYKAYWKCHKCNYRWDTQIQVRTQGHSSCHRCTNTALIHGVNDLETLFPEIAKEWHPIRNGSLKASDVKPGRRYKAWWKCSKCGYEWQISPNNRTSNKSGCPKCSMGKRTSYPEQALYYYVKQLFPDAINGFKAPFLGKMELDIYIPSLKWAIEYDGKRWHKKEKIKQEQIKYKKCTQNGIKLFRIREEMAELGSDIADEQIGIVKFNEKEDLEETILYVIKRLNFLRKSIDINLARDETAIRATYQNKSKNSIAVLYPNLVAEWDYEKNGELTPDRVNIGSKYKAHWICPTCGYKYRTSVNNRTSNKSGCIKCANKKNAVAKSKAVYMIDSKTKRIIEKFISISDASRKMNISSGHIVQVCQGTRHKIGGYIWEYANPKENKKYQKSKKQLEFDLK